MLASNTEAAPPQPGTRERILRAAVDLAQETGLRKLSMDEISCRADVARATLYTHFPGRQALLDAAIQLQLEELFTNLQAVSDRYEDPDERLVHTFAAAYRRLREHRVLNAVLRVNPQILLPYVFGESPAIELGREFVERNLPPSDPASRITREETAEHIVRALHTLILAPSTVFDLDAAGGAEDYARRFLLPLLR